MGLITHQMGGFDIEKTRNKFSIPEQFNIMSFMAIGYQGEENILDDEMKESELAQRKRMSLGSEFFDGTWDKPIV